MEKEKKIIDAVEKANLEYDKIQANRKKIYQILTKQDNEEELLKQNRKLNKLLEKAGLEVYDYSKKKKKG